MRSINDAGLALIKTFESFSSKPYQDGGGVWTIGYGHTHGVTANDPAIDESEGDALLLDDLDIAERIVDNAVDSDLTDNQFSALVSFVFNVGPGEKGVKDGFVTLKSGEPSTLLTLLNDEDFDEAADEFQKWIRVAGKPCAGLVRRRAAEKALFLTA